MPNPLHPRLSATRRSWLYAIVPLAFLMPGCASKPLPVTPLHEDARSAVFLQTVSDRSFHAAHPLKLDQRTVEDVLRGIRTEKKASFTVLIGKALQLQKQTDPRAFSEDDIDALAPHLTTALAQAAPNQRIQFQLRYAAGFATPIKKKGAPSVETTDGYLFADGLSLILTLTEFAPGKMYTSDTKAEPRIPADPIGMVDREVKFSPEAAMRPKSDGWFGSSDDHTVAIDYQLMSKLLATPQPPTPGVAPIAGQQGQPVPLQQAPAASGAELRSFREQLKAMQKKLDEQNAELQELKKSSPKNN